MYERASPYMTSLVNIGDDFDDPDNRERDRWLSLGVAYQRSLSARVALKARAYGLLNEYNWFARRSAAEECPAGLSMGCERNLTGTGSSVGADLRFAIDVPELKGATTLGVDSRLRRAVSDLDIVDRTSGAVSPIGNDYTRNDGLFAPYLQQSFSPARWLDANLGLRLDYDTRFGAQLSPRAALGVTPWRDSRFKAIYAEAFRGPTAYELNYADPSSQVASPNLNAESVRSGELSIEQRVGAQRLFFGVFRSWWADMVSYRTLGEEELQGAVDRGALMPGSTLAWVYANTGSLDSFGYNASYEGSVARKLRFGMNLTAAYSRIDYGDGSGQLPLTVGPSFFGNARVSYELGGSLPTPALAAHYQAARPTDRAFDGGFVDPPYAPADLHLRLTFSGVMPGVAALRYRLSGTYGSASRGPYVIGPNHYAYDETSRATLSPQRRLSGFLGLEYVIK